MNCGHGPLQRAKDPVAVLKRSEGCGLFAEDPVGLRLELGKISMDWYSTVKHSESARQKMRAMADLRLSHFTQSGRV